MFMEDINNYLIIMDAYFLLLIILLAFIGFYLFYDKIYNTNNLIFNDKSNKIIRKYTDKKRKKYINTESENSINSNWDKSELSGISEISGLTSVSEGLLSQQNSDFNDENQSLHSINSGLSEGSIDVNSELSFMKD